MSRRQLPGYRPEASLFPPRHVLSSAFSLLALFSFGTSVAASDEWVGHGPPGGIVNTIAIDPSSPSTAYAGTSYGGVFKSTDNGASWSTSNNGLAVRLINALAIDPANPSTIYAGTYSQALEQPSLFKSTDGGASWAPSATGLNGRFGRYTSVDCIALDQSTPATLYAGTQEGPYKSTDAGASWTSVGTFSVSSLAIDPSAPATLYAGSSQAMYKSTDGGANWLQIGDFTGTTVVAIVIDVTDPAVLYAAHVNGVSKSVDGGQNWQSLPTGLTHPNLWELAIDPSNHNVLYVGGHRTGYLDDEYGVFKTSDGGANWTQVVVGMEDQFSVGAIAIDPANPSTAYAGGWSSNYKLNSRSSPGGVYKTINGASSWALANSGLTNSFVHSVTVSPANPNTLYAGLSSYVSPSTTNFGVSRSFDGGATWSLASEGLLDPYNNWTSPIYDIAVDPTNPDRLYAAGAGGVFKSFDGGDNWEPSDTGIGFNQYGVDIAINPASPSTLYLATSNGYGLYRSTDYGANWSLVRSAFAFAMDQASPTVLYAADPSGLGVSKSSDGGDSWGSPVPVCYSLNGLAVAADSSAIYAGCSDGVWKSTDGGATWNPYNDGLSNLRVTSLLADPAHPNTIYAGADQNLFNTGAVFRSTDAGAHWSVVGEGLPPLFVYGMALSTDGKLYAATEGGGVFAVTLSACDSPTAAVSGDASICAGTSTIIQAALTGTAPWNVTWSDGVTQTGVSSTPATRSVNPSSTTTYTVTAVSDAECAGTSSGSAVVTVNPRPTAVASGSATIPPGGSAPLSGSGGVSCAWSPATGLSDPASCAPTASPSSTTTYTLTVTDASGCASTNNPTVTVTVASQTPTTTTLVSSLNPSAFGQPVTFTASVTAGSGTPAGTVTFRDGVISIGTRTLDGSGHATLTTAALGTGSHSITAFYAGNPSFAPSTSGALSQIVTNSAACGALLPAVMYSVATGPRAVVAADFNGDGKLDLATANQFSEDVSVLIGNGNGTFQSTVNYPVGSAPQALAFGDFDGDGVPDLAVANAGSDTLTILIGNGDGTFQVGTSVVVGSFPISVAAGDFDRDGRLDLAVANANSGTVSILIGNGDGTFQAAVNYSGGINASAVAVGDVNGDGLLDLAVGNPGSSSVTILIGSGDGTFTGGGNFGTGSSSSPRSVTFGDFNGDGKADLAVASSQGASVLLLGNGDGTFQSPLTIGFFGNSYSVAIGDLNGDGKLDVAITNGDSPGQVFVVLGNGDGTFGGATPYSAGTYAWSSVVADFNADGKPDLAVANTGSNDVSILLGACRMATTTQLTTSVNPSDSGQPVTFTATVTSASGTPTGMVTFKDGATTLGTGTLDIGGAATYSTSALSSGTHFITAVYGGDGSFAGSTSATLTQTVSGFPYSERTALIALYNNTNGAGWTNSANWLSAPGTECTWRGVACDTGGTTVIQLVLANNNLTGTLPAELEQLSNLQRLALGLNHLTGNIPAQLGNLTGLTLVDLQLNQLTGPIPAEFANLSNLQTLDLDFNRLSGGIPAWLGSLQSLVNLTMIGNGLGGVIPRELGNLPNLRELFLLSNNLTGTIPSELGNLATLQFLYLGGNSLTGSIPPGLANLTALRTLFLSSNQLSGSIPAQLGALTSLTSLYLDNNQLTGPIPPELGNLSHAVNFYLSFNQLSGSIPMELGGLAGARFLHLERNNLTGGIPASLGNLTQVLELYVNGNRLTGPLPAELGNLSTLQKLFVNGNQLSGPIPGTFSNLTALGAGSLDLRWNALFSTDGVLVAFLNSRQVGGDWQSTQTITPAGLNTSGATSSAITVNWTPIAYIADDGSYQVFYATTPGGSYTAFSTTTTNKSASSLTVTGLAANTAYYFVVQTTTLPHSSNQNTVVSGYSTEATGMTLPACPTATVSGTAAVCKGSATTIQAALTGTPPWNLTWSDGFVQNGIAAGPATRSVAPTVTTTYTVTAVSDANCTGTGSGSAVVTVEFPPKAAVSGDTTICAGSSATIQAALTGTAPWTLAWSDGLTQTVSVSPATRVVSPTATTIYSVTALADAACAGTSSGSATVKVNPPPSAVITAPAAVCADSTGNSASVPNAGSGATYAWSITNGTITLGAGTRSIKFTAGSSGSVGLSVIVTKASCSATGSTSVPVNPVPVAAITAPTSVCHNSTGNVASVPDAGPGATYAWTATNATITGGIGTRSITFAVGNKNATLKVTVTNASGCSSSSSKVVTVNTGC
jgi:Leucine-rich repeat (LRR) protein